MIRRGLLLALLLGASCATAQRGIPIVKEKDIDDPQIRRGQIVFHQFCHPCHPGGAGGLGFALNNKPLPEPLIEEQVRRGLGAMPSFSPEVIPDRDLEAVVEYLKWLRDLEPKIALETD